MYKMITFDMDGTLLSSEQTITEKSAEAIRRAAGNGKTVALCTGRSVSEIDSYVNLIPDVRYAICVSGALVYDLWEHRKLHTGYLPRETVLEALDIAGTEDTMVQFLETELIVETDKCQNAGRYHMGEYIPLFDACALKVEDIRSYYAAVCPDVAKMNVYHTDTAAKERNRKRFLDAGLPVTIKDAELTSLELSANGVNKGTGLKALCSHLEISTAETIAVGDAANDLDVLMTAGLPIAMGNAWKEIKKAVLKNGGVIVRDNDHDGCAEAIDNYLLSK